MSAIGNAIQRYKEAIIAEAKAALAELRQKTASEADAKIAEALTRLETSVEAWDKAVGRPYGFSVGSVADIVLAGGVVSVFKATLNYSTSHCSLRDVLTGNVLEMRGLTPDHVHLDNLKPNEVLEVVIVVTREAK